MKLTRGKPEIKIGLIDGPVVTQHPELIEANIQQLGANSSIACSQVDRTACQHGTLVAGILCGKRNSVAPAICPSCTLLVRPVFTATSANPDRLPGATPKELSMAILEYLAAGNQETLGSSVITRHSWVLSITLPCMRSGE